MKKGMRTLLLLLLLFSTYTNSNTLRNENHQQTWTSILFSFLFFWDLAFPRPVTFFYQLHSSIPIYHPVYPKSPPAAPALQADIILKRESVSTNTLQPTLRLWLYFVLIFPPKRPFLLSPSPAPSILVSPSFFFWKRTLRTETKKTGLKHALIFFLNPIFSIPTINACISKAQLFFAKCPFFSLSHAAVAYN